MKRRSTVLKLIVLGLTVSATAATPTSDPVQLARSVDEHYNGLRSLQAEFTEIYQGAGMDRTETGILWLKKPGKMRWEYRSPREKLFVSDGKDAWFYLPGERQARKTPVRKLEDLRSPLALLLGKTHLEKELQGLSFAPDVSPLMSGNVVLRGVPKGLGDRVSQILLEITADHEIARVQIEEADGSRTEYRFSQQRENVEVLDSRFQFRPPRDVETVEDLGPSE